MTTKTWVTYSNSHLARVYIYACIRRVYMTLRSIRLWWWSLYTLCLLTWELIVSIGDSGPCCCVYMYDIFHMLINSLVCWQVCNRQSLEIQGTALSKSLRAWTCIYRSMPAGVAQSRHAFVGGTVSTWVRWWIPANKRQKRHQKYRSNTHCLQGTCRSDSRFPLLVV